MQGLVYRKSCTAVIVVLFIGISIVPSISGSIGGLSIASSIEEVSDISSKLKKTNENDIAIYDESAVFGTRLFDTGNSFGNTIYVDDDGGADYTSIQDAIDAADDGDMIYVFGGRYFENIIINKSIKIKGENRNNTIIDGNNSGNTVNIIANSVELIDLSVQHCGTNDNAGIYVQANNCTITRNNISHNDWAIFFKGSSSKYNEITHNYFCSNRLGIYFSSSDYNYVYKNTFIKSGRGVNFCAFATNNNIDDNFLINSSISLFQSNNNLIQNNNIINSQITLDISYHNEFVNNFVNYKPVIYIEDESNKTIDIPAGQIIVVNCDNITISNQEISNVGRGIQLFKSKFCTIVNNTLFCGIYFGSSSYNIIKGNIINNSGYDNNGSWLGGSDNLIENNRISYCWWGIYLGWSKRNDIRFNNISYCNMGIYLNSAHENNIHNNEFIRACVYSKYSRDTIIDTNNFYDGNGIYLYDGSHRNIIDNNEFDNLYKGIYIYGTVDNPIENTTINNNIFSMCDSGILLTYSKNNTINNSNITNNRYGIKLFYSNDNIICYNNISLNSYSGIIIEDESHNNIIYSNNFFNNMENARDSCNNSWDYNKRGNYWSDYEDIYPNASKRLFLGTWVTPYNISDGDNKDYYPCINPVSLSNNEQKSWWEIIFELILDFLKRIFPWFDMDFNCNFH